MNILIAGHDTFHNKGCQALVFTTAEMLKGVFPDASFHVFSWEPEYDQAHFDNKAIQCKFIRHRFQVNEFSLRNQLWLKIRNLGINTDRILWVAPSFYEAIRNCDLMVISGGDILADYGEEAVRHYFFPIAVAKALRKPVYVFAQSISPYKSNDVLRFCKKYLDSVDLITVRERISYDYVKTVGIKAPCYLTADPAFHLNPSSETRLNEIMELEGIRDNARLKIGISVSETLTKWSDADHGDFLKSMSMVCDSVIQKYQAQIIFVPHVTYPDNPHNDDRITGEKIYDLINLKDNVHMINGDYSCSDLKAIIGKCDVFIGARTHATIASSSQLVPTLALAYSTKAFGIMSDVFDKEQCTFDIKREDISNLLIKTDNLIENRLHIKELMKDRIDLIKKRSLLNGKLARDIFHYD